MHITDLRAFQPATPGSPPDWRTQLGQIIVEVVTNEEVVGVGVGGGGAAGVHVVQTVLRDLLLGRDPQEVEELYRQMHRHTSLYGRGGLVSMAISGVDLALWDIRGKVANQPVAALLNAAVDLTRPIPTYATVFDDHLASAKAVEGCAGVKLHVERFGEKPNVNEIADLVAATREAIGGDTILMIDAFARWNLESTLNVAEAVAPFEIAWLEEPLPPDDIDGYSVLAGICRVPIAGGEHEYTIDGFLNLLEKGLFTILQPDINWCGGLTTFVELYRLAEEAGVRVCPHRGCEPYALAAIAALGQQALAESPRSWFRCLDGAPNVVEGRVKPSAAPGFGVSICDQTRYVA